MEELKRTILIVEDDAGLVELISERIHDFGYQTICISSGAGALEWLKAYAPLLMVLDYSLPDMTAKEFIKALNPKTQSIPPFVLATGRGDERIAVDMMKLGARDYIIKDSRFLDMIPMVVSRVCIEIENETKLKQTELALIESNRFSRQIIDCAREGVVVYDNDLRVITWNPYIENLLDYKEADVIGKSVLDFYPQLKETGVVENLKSALQGIIKPGIEFDYRSEVSGKQICVSVEVSALRNADGEIIGAISIVRDITERKMAESVLLESESRYHTLFNSSFEAILLTSPDGTILSANQAACTMFGLTEEELCRGGRDSVVDLADPGLPAALEERARTGKFSGELMFVRSNGEKFPAEVSSSFFKDRDGNIRTSMIIRDITERKRAQDTLQANRDMLSKLLYVSTEFIDSGFESIDYKKTTDTILDISGAKYASFNLFEDDGLDFTTVAMSGLDGIQQKAKSILGYDVVNNKWGCDPVRAGKLKGNVITRFDSFIELVGSSVPRTIALVVENMFNLGDVYVVQIVKNNKAIGDFTLLFKKGDTIKNREIVELYASQVGLFIERLNSERALRKSEEIYRDLVMKIPDGVYKSSSDGRFLDVNPAMIKMLGYETKEEIMEIDILSELYFDIADREVNLLNSQKEIMSEFRLKKKDGTGIWIEDHGWYNTDVNGDIISHEGVLRDITERKLAEEALQASEDKYRTIIENSNDMIWAVDLEGNFTFSNEIAERVTGLKLENWIGKSFIPILSPQDVPKVIDIHLRTISGENCSYELSITKADGTVLILSINTSPICNQGKIEGAVNFARNITDRKLAEQALAEKMNELIRFHDLTVDRELAMIELKKEVNDLLKKYGQKEKYKIIQ